MKQLDYEGCTQERYDGTIVVKDKGSKSRFTINNRQKQRVHEIHVDGCLFTERDARARCDYLLSVDEDTPRAFYVELKGQNIEKAITQLAATLENTQDKFGKHQKHCFIISSKVPKFTARNQKASKKRPSPQQRFQAKYQSTLTIKNNQHTVTL